MALDQNSRLLRLGEKHFSDGNLEEARYCFEAVLKEDPSQAEALNNLGVLALRKQETQVAINYFASSLESDPFYRDAILNFADLLQDLGLGHEVIPYLEKAADRYPQDQELISTLRKAKGLPTGMLPWKLCYSSGIANHGENARRLLVLEHYIPSLHIHEPVWFFGIYFDSDYHQLQAHLGRKIINWRGADTQRMLHKQERFGVIQNTKALHVCQAWHQKEFLARLGIPSIVRPMMNTPPEKVEPTPFPKKTEILVYWRAGDDRYIQADLFFEVAAKCPEVLFHVVGSEDSAKFQGSEKRNIRFHGYVSEEDLDLIMDQCKGTIRPWMWDGNPNIQTRMLLKGRYAAHSCRFEKVSQCTTADDYVRWINNLKETGEPNIEARKWWMEHLNNFDFLETDFEPDSSTATIESYA